jgi:hypothetical protein
MGRTARYNNSTPSGVWERRQEAQQLWHNQLARVILEVVTGVLEASVCRRDHRLRVHAPRP